MANTKLQFKRTTVSGRLPNTTISANTSYIDAGEFAINLADGKVVSSNGTVTFEVGANLSSLNVASSIAVGVATINSTIYSATANNANNLGGTSLATLQGEITGNAATAYTNATIYSANASNLGNGTVAPARLGSGTANSTTVLYGNSVWAVIPVVNAVVTISEQFTANGTANSFTISGGYTPSQVAVFVNGVKQLPITDVDITSGTTINLTSTPANGYAVDVFGYNTVIPGVLTTANTALFLSNSSGTLVNIQNYITGNAATAYTNAIAYSANADNISSGTVTPARLGSGTANSTTILYGNGVWAVAPASTNVDAQYAWTNTNSFSANVLIAGNATSQLLIGTINATSIGMLANSTVLTIGNSSVNTTVNATSFSGIANDANNLGGTSLATLQTQITGNAATAYSNGTSYTDIKAGNAYTNATSYVTTGGYTITGAVTYSANVNIAGNTTSVLNIGTINATSIGLSANSTVLTMGNSSVNTTVNATSFSGTANNADNLGGLSLGQVQGNAASNAATAYTNATSYADIKAGNAYTNATSYADIKAGNAYTNATTYVTTGGYTISGVVTHSGNVILTSGNATNRLLIGIINATSIGMLANSTVLTVGNSSVNTSINATSFSGIANNANNLGGTSLATLQTQITGNAATAYTNATSYADTKAGTAYTNATTYVTTGGYTISGVVTHSGNAILTSGNATNQLLIGTINATSIGLLANSTVLTVGNSSVNTSINATSIKLFSATSNIAITAPNTVQASNGSYFLNANGAYSVVATGGDPIVNTLTYSASLSLDSNLSSYYYVAATGNPTISITGNNAVGTLRNLTLIFNHSGGVRSITFGGTNIKFTDNTAPVLSNTSGGTDVLTFFTYDQGANWNGALGWWSNT